MQMLIFVKINFSIQCYSCFIKKLLTAINQLKSISTVLKEIVLPVVIIIIGNNANNYQWHDANGEIVGTQTNIILTKKSFYEKKSF